jgi:hypothetical protein
LVCPSAVKKRQEFDHSKPLTKKSKKTVGRDPCVKKKKEKNKRRRGKKKKD